MKLYRLITFLAVVSLMLASVGTAPSLATAQGTTPPWATNLPVTAQSNFNPQLRVPGGETMTSEMLTKFLPVMSSSAANVVANKLGMQALGGKKIDSSKFTDMDNIVNADDNFAENEPSLAVNPANEAIVVAFHHYIPADPCLAMVSFDGGDTFDFWNYVFPPMQAAGNFCSDPIVRFSPDGAYAYYFYMDIDSGGSVSDVVVQRASGYNPTVLIGSPIVIFNDYGDFPDKPWGDVAYYDTTGASDGVVYTTTTLFTAGGGCYILFNRSLDYGATWLYGDLGITLDGNSGCSPVVQGSRPIGNAFSGWVTACHYYSETDGFRTGKFDIRCATNDENGDWLSGSATNYFFTPVNNKNELSEWLGPSSSYHRWWGGMFPSLAMDDTGLVYIAFVADPDTNQSNVEAGNVYVSRGWPPGSVLPWGSPVTVGNNPSGTPQYAQGYPTITARCNYQTAKCYSYIAYFDHISGNLKYNIVYRKGTRPFSTSSVGSLSLATKKKISDVTSFSDFIFIGDYIDSFVTSRRYEVIWTDRSDAMGIMDFDDDVMHDALLP